MTPEINMGMEDLRGRIVQMEHRITELLPRLAQMEEWKNQKNVSDARLELTMGTIVEDLKGIKSGIGKILWAIGMAVIVAIVTWLLSGGLNRAKEVAFQYTYGSPNVTVKSYQDTQPCEADKPVFVSSYCRARPLIVQR